MTRSVFVRCKSGNNAFADCEIYRRGDLLRIVGYPTMDFTREDALQLAEAILTIYQLDRAAPDPAPAAASGNMPASSENAKLVETISFRLGNLEADLSDDGAFRMDTLEAVRAIQETALVAALFLERLHDDLERTISDGR